MTWTVQMVAQVRAMRRDRWGVTDIQHAVVKPRAEVIEAIDQTIREQDNREALARLNEVLNLQRQGVRLINGKPEPLVLKRR